MDTDIECFRCFLCRQEIDIIDTSIGTSSEPLSNSVSTSLCKIFQITGKETEIEKHGQINYCLSCSNRISNTLNLLNEVEKLEKEILDVRHSIHSQLNQNSEYLKNPLRQFCVEILREIKSKGIHTELWKIGKRRILNGCGRVIKCVTIPKLSVSTSIEKEASGSGQILGLPFHSDNPSEKKMDNQSSIHKRCTVQTQNELDSLRTTNTDSTVDVFNKTCFDNLEIEEQDQMCGFYNETIKLEIESEEYEYRSSPCPSADHDLFGGVDYAPKSDLHYNEDSPQDQLTCERLENSANKVKKTRRRPKSRGKTTVRKQRREVQVRPKVQSIRVTTNDGRLKCNLCDKTFSTKKKVRVHERVHTLAKVHKCPYCPKSYKERTQLRTHKRLHTGERPFACQFCGKSFMSRCVRKEHENLHTGERPYKCETCGRTFIQRSGLKYHELTHKEKSHLCKYCGRGFRSRFVMTVHERVHTGESKHKCPYCQKGFPFECQLIPHLRIHTGEKPFLCQYCEQTFSTRDGLKRHEKVHTKTKIYTCEICQEEFRVYREFQKHTKRSHTTEKHFKCTLCDKIFKRKASLKPHMRTHTGEKPFKCKYCDRGFAQLGGVVFHERVHTGEKPYKCEFCEKTFISRTHVKSHERTHTGERPYVCSECGKAFANCQNRKIHKCKKYRNG